MRRGDLGRALRRALVLLVTTVGVIGGAIVADGYLSGWAGLARDFAAPPAGRDLQLSLEEGGVGERRWFHRVAPLEAAIGFGGLRLSYPFPYRLAHPALEIPWRELRIVSVTAGTDGTALVLGVSDPERARITLRGDLATVVREWLAPRARN